MLRLRESRSRKLSKQSTDLTDDEDLGLPKSLQNSPGDFSDGLEVTGSGSQVGPGWGTSRHHSSCSDNSLLSLDSFSEAVEETVSPHTRAGGDGRLSHQAARHKMAVRPRRNHAVRPPRNKLQQLEEREEPEPSQESRHPEIMRSFEEQRAKSKSLDMSYRSEPPSPAAMQQMSQSSQEKPKGRRSEPEGFLSRLFGSRRQKMRSSVGSVGEGDVGRVGVTRGSGEPARLSYYQGSCNNYQLPQQQPPPLSSPSPPPPARQKTKPPAPPPPDSPPPLQGRPLFLCTTLTYNRH